MATTTVYGCDWCDNIVQRTGDGTPQFAARIKSNQIGGRAPIGAQPKVYEICDRCFVAFKALTEGKYRR